MNETVRGIRSMADGEHYTILEGNNIVRYGYAAAGQGEQMLPKPTANLVVTDYAFSPDERQILIASGARPIYRHSYTTDYFLASGNSLMPILREAEAPRDASFSPDGKLIAYSDRNDLYVYDTAGKRTRRITDDGAWNSVINGTTDWVYEEEFGTTRAYAFSPDGGQLAFLRFDESEVPLMEMMRFDGKLYNEAYSFKYPKAGEKNSAVQLWVADLATGRKHRIDTGGETDQYIPRIGYTPDGRLWFYRLNRRQNTFEMVLCEPHGGQRVIYEEEFGFTRAYAFSPDSRRIAYLRFDESEVPLMEMMRFDGKLYNQAYSFKYPKAGERNSTVEVWVCDLATGTRERIDTGGVTDQYIPRIGWTPDGRLYFFRLNRRQNTFEVILCEPNGAQRTIYDERSQQYVERVDDKTITFIDGDRFLVRQEGHTGYMHLYLYSIRKGLLAQVTKGDWEVTDVVGTDGKRVWYLSTETSPLRRNLYSVRLDGKDKRRLTTGEGYYAIAPSAGMKYYISTFSNATTPNRVEVCDNEGNPIRTLADSRKLREELAVVQRPVREFFTFTTERGDTLNAYIVKPRGFDPSQRYPVLLTQYSGPGSQSVSDRWSLDWEDALTDKGYIVVCADGRGTGFRGEKFKKSTYGRLGAQEVEDQLSFARYMAAQPYVDPARIGIYGWSYGGFMALGCAMKGHGLFRMAIAVAPVTSWRYYDSIYTEIYNNLPQYNAAGYDDNSPINFARMLDDTKTRLLIIHGTADDNVHFQNSVEMARALNRCGKQYDMMVYPDQNHSMQPDDTANVRQKMIEYTLEHL